jgi:hypothetical protein
MCRVVVLQLDDLAEEVELLLEVAASDADDWVKVRSCLTILTPVRRSRHLFDDF